MHYEFGGLYMEGLIFGILQYLITLSLKIEIIVLEKVLNFGSKNQYEPCTLLCTKPKDGHFGES